MSCLGISPIASRANWTTSSVHPRRRRSFAKDNAQRADTVRQVRQRPVAKCATHLAQPGTAHDAVIMGLCRPLGVQPQLRSFGASAVTVTKGDGPLTESARGRRAGDIICRTTQEFPSKAVYLHRAGCRCTSRNGRVGFTGKSTKIMMERLDFGDVHPYLKRATKIRCSATAKARKLQTKLRAQTLLRLETLHPQNSRGRGR